MEKSWYFDCLYLGQYRWCCWIHPLVEKAIQIKQLVNVNTYMYSIKKIKLKLKKKKKRHCYSTDKLTFALMYHFYSSDYGNLKIIIIIFKIMI